MIIIPAIDLLDGSIVRLKQGRYDDVTVYHTDPLAFASTLAEKGHTRLHVVDLNGAKDGKLVNLSLITKITEQTGLEVQTGGGIRSLSDIKTLFSAGLKRVVSSSMAIKKPDEWLEAIRLYGEQCIFGMDLKGGNVAIGGWLETSSEPLETFLEPMLNAGLKEVLCTDISRDGMMSGPNVGLYKKLQSRFPDLHFIASGGVSSNADLDELRQAELFAVVVGRAWLEGKVQL